MNWKLKITPPSGETKTIKLKGSERLGAGEDCSIQVRDPIFGENLGVTLWLKTDPTQTRVSPWWLKLDSSMPDARIANIPFREANVPEGIPIQIGDSIFKIENEISKLPLPEYPKNCTPWITQSIEGQKVLWDTKKSADTSLSIYLQGETGTGKEVLAQLVHRWSSRKGGPFVAVNCGALPISLAESELFGHVKGAFTGAHNFRTGALMQAHNGTLFLDEIGDLPLDIQVKLLRFLESGEIRPVGSDHAARANVRLVCATHQDLKKLVEEGKFRRDLYYRVASITISIPSLKSRPNDIEILAKGYAADNLKNLSDKALYRLKAYSWPGNVRELRHAVERACGLSGAFQTILSEDNFDFLVHNESMKDNPEATFGRAMLTLEEMERVMIIKALNITNGNRERAANTLGIARSTLFEMLKRYKIAGPKQRLVH